MERIEIICTVIGAVAVVLGGVWFIVQQAFNFGKNANRLDSIETNVGKLETNVGELRTNVSKLETNVGRLETNVGELRTNVSRLENEFSGFKNELSNFKSEFSGFKNEFSNFRKNISLLPCVSHSEDIMKIKTVLIKKYPGFARTLIIKSSPRILSPVGTKIFNDVDGDNFLNENKESLFKYITTGNPLAKLDVEKLSYGACLSLTHLPVFNAIKDYVYNAPAIDIEGGEKHEIDLDDVCFVLSIRLRDMYLEENPSFGSNEPSGKVCVPS